MLGIIIGPSLKWFNPARWWGQSLVVLMNENEARPCGGFVTAYGVVNVPFGGVELNNSFAFPAVDLGLNQEPLRQVAREKRFWDLGTSANLNRCGQEFVSAYERATDNFPDRVFLVQSSVIENYLSVLGPVEAGELILADNNFFALTSRLVADIDRHDEATLAERKNPLHLFGKRLIVSTIMRPWRWYDLSRVIHTAEQNGELYWHRPGLEKTPLWQRYQDQTIAVSEWNLGGGKSSRYLDKQWNVFLKQVSADEWSVEHQLNVTHLGQADNPLSQAWRGGFQIELFNREDRFVPAEIPPGGTFTHREIFTLKTSDLFQVFNPEVGEQARFNLYAPPYQDWRLNLQISALAQQTIQPLTRNLAVRENSATWRGDSSFQGQAFSFALTPDTLAPFLTWHKPLLEPSETVTEQLGLVEGDIVVELHFNEPIVVLNAPFEVLEDTRKRFAGSDINIRLNDRNYEIEDVTVDLAVQSALLFPDNTTLLLKVRPEPYQLNERYYLEIIGIADSWGNTKNITNRTVITR